MIFRKRFPAIIDGKVFTEADAWAVREIAADLFDSPAAREFKQACEELRKCNTDGAVTGLRFVALWLRDPFDPRAGRSTGESQ